MTYGSGKGADYKTDTGFAGYRNFDNSINDLVLYLADNNYNLDYARLWTLNKDQKTKGYYEDTLDNYFKGVKAKKAQRNSIAEVRWNFVN